MASKRLVLAVGLAVGLVAGLVLALEAPARAEGATSRAPTGVDVVLTVCPVGCDHSTVQAAVDAAGANDEIWVATGTYTDLDVRAAPPGYVGAAVISQVVYLDESVTVRGGYRGDFGDWDPLAYPTTLDAGGQGRVMFVFGEVAPTIEGLRLTGGDASGLGGHDWGTTPPNTGGGLYVMSATATISGNWISNNTAGDSGLDAFAHGGGLGLVHAEANLTGNTISGNTAEIGGGLWAFSSTLTLNGNTISGNLVESNANNGGGGLYLDDSAANLTGNTISGNTSDNNGGGVYLFFSDQVTFSDNLIFSNTAVYGGGLYLNRSSPTISGNRIEGNTASNSGGGGNLDRGSPVVSGNVISGNVASNGGGLRLYYGAATVSDNEFLFNTANQGGGVYGSFAGGVTLSHNTFRGNTANYSGGGMRLYQHGPTLEANTIVSNTAMKWGGGVALESSSAQFSGNTIWGNRVISGSGGGLYVYRGSPVMVNDVVAANQVLTSGAGLYVEAATPRLLHATLAENVGGDGSGVYAASYGDASMVVMSNTILVSHTVGVYAGSYSTVTLEGTLWGNDVDWAGDGLVLTGTVNVWGNPDFVYPDGGNYRIGPGSAARDAGIDAGVTVDIDGNPRPVGAGYDVGVDEWGPCDPLAGVEISGPVTGTVGEMAAFTATIEPPTATQPVAYVWQPEPDTGQGIANVTYVWSEGGAVTLTVEAVNCGGGVSDVHLVEVSWPTPGPGEVVIDEVAWSGTAASTSDEWIELHSLVSHTVSLEGCELLAEDATPAALLAGELAAGGYYLMERGDEQTVSDVPADLIYSGAMSNLGEWLLLVCSGETIDQVNAMTGWPAGTDGGGEPPYASMERSETGVTYDDDKWYTNDGIHRNGLDALGDPINGTPGGGNSPYCPAPLAGVDLAGPVEGTVGMTYTFTATVEPIDATEPVSLEFGVSGSEFWVVSRNVVTVTWATTGAKAITVTAENCGGPVSATHVITISEPPPTCTAISGVNLAGPVTGTTGAPYVFTATVEPIDATEPVSFEFGVSGGEWVQGDNVLTATWATTGTKWLTVTAENCGGVVSDTHTITVEAPPEPPTCTAISGVDLTGPVSGTVGASYSFVATITPGTASLPVTYTWEAMEQSAFSGQLSTISYTWSTTGTKWVTVTVENRCSGPVSDTHQVAIEEAPPVTYTVYLPVMWREIPPAPVGDAPDDCPGYSAEAGRSYREDFDYQNDNDWFYFSVAAGETYVVETGDLGPEANTYLYLWSGDCAVKLAEDDDGGEGLGSRIEWTATATGKLAAMVQSWDWQVYGPETGYTLKIEAVDGRR